MVVVERVGSILFRLQRRKWTGATNDVEDRLVDVWLSRSGEYEAVAEEVVKLWISTSESSSDKRSRCCEKVSSHSFVMMILEEGL